MGTPRFHDRVTDRALERLPASGEPGRFRVLSGGVGVRIHDLPAHEGDYLLPLETDDCAVAEVRATKGATSAETVVHTVKLDREQLPGEELTRALLHCAQQVQAALDAGDWAKLAGLNPLVPDLGRDLGLQPLEELIGRDLGRVEEVFRAPRTHLTLERERLPVSRVRRMAPEVTTYLATHTEDWERRTLHGVRPKRLLSLLADEQQDLYENRVAARLVDRLSRYLGKRIHEVETLKQVCEDALEAQRQLLEGKTHWGRANRIFSLWSEAIDAQEGVQQAERTLAELGRLRRRLLRLLDTPLYRAIPRRAQVENTLRNTNILVNDPNYRRIRDLWNDYLEHGAEKPLTSEQKLAAGQEQCRAYERFCLLIVARALEDLELSPAGARQLPGLAGEPVELTDGSTRLILELRPDGSLRLQDRTPPPPGGGPNAPLRFVPLAAALSRGAESRLHEESSANERELTVILYPSSPAERQALPMERRRKANRLPNARRKGETEGPGVLPVSPYEIESIERVGRALRWWIAKNRYPAYPPRLEPVVTPPGIPLPLAEWFDRNPRKQAIGAVKRLPTPQEDRELAGWMARVEQEASRRRGAAATVQDQLTALRSQLDQAWDYLRQLLRCPLCGKQAEKIQPRDQDTFIVACPCGAQWGLRRCGSGQCPPYPFLWSNKGVPDGCRDAAWLDRTLGRDVLALPCEQGSSDGLICPSCGVCQNEGKAANQECGRCRPTLTARTAKATL